MHAIAHHLADQLPHALQRMEQSRDVAELVALFADDAVLSNLGAGHGQHGADGARHFWQGYLERFAEIRSEFTHLHMSERAVILEWISEGRHNDGRPPSYRGVSILAFYSHAKINYFRAYYDSAVFLETTATRGVEE